MLAPCEPWISEDDLAESCSAPTAVMTPTEAVVTASWLLFHLSAQQFGVCSETVRPCRQGCNCWTALRGSWGGYCWSDDCGCGYLSETVLPGAEEVTEVKVDGAVLDASRYRLDWPGRLVRTDGQAWPNCQNLAAADDQVGTWSVTYAWGVPVPEAGRLAAEQLACHLLATGSLCGVPAGTTQITRQGVTIQRGQGMLTAFGVERTTGLALVDGFLLAANPTGAQRRPSVWSPDVHHPRRA